MSESTKDAVIIDAEVLPTADEVKLKDVAAQIQVVLESNGTALQPYMMFSEFGVQPSVRLVVTKSDNTNEQGTDTGSDKVAEDKVEPTETTQS